tara:strand:- start:60 stop:737 length:678 start_codon:yes stop_codon:yes gene_type:complete
MNDNKIISIMPEAMGIFKINESNHNEYKKLIFEIIETASDNLKRDSRTGSPLYHICSKKDQNLFNQFPQLSHLKSELINCCLYYINLTGYLCEEVVVNDAWLNIGQKGSILQWHNHSNSYLSGTYYINFDPIKHSSLAFKNDRLNTTSFNTPSITIPVNEKSKTVFNSPSFQINAKEGDILIWKSNLIHGYEIPNKDKNRITLSFNIMPKECTDGNIFSFKVSSV